MPTARKISPHPRRDYRLPRECEACAGIRSGLVEAVRARRFAKAAQLAARGAALMSGLVRS
ncbi:MAG: hypothetical protein AB7S70_16060 [Hyphomicrobium sp.]|uniref:hypothetical protein n=1 Tax=Hyphomicrobium sp. TaxID=82 RepID=UPI003D0BCFC6